MVTKSPDAGLAPQDDAPVESSVDAIDAITEEDVASYDDAPKDESVEEADDDEVAEEETEEDDAEVDDTAEESDDEPQAPKSKLPKNWRDNPEIKAVLEEEKVSLKRQVREELEPAVLKRIDAILADPDKEKEAGRFERRIVNKLREMGGQSVEQAVSTRVASLYAPFEQLEQEFIRYVEHYGDEVGRAEFSKLVTSDPERGKKMVAWQEHLKANGIDANASVEQVRKRALESETKRVASERQQQMREQDPDDVFEEFMDRPEWGQLTAQQRASLQPKNFQGTPAKKMLAMAEKYGEYKNTLNIKARRNAALTEAERLNGQSDIAADLAEKLPPTVSGRVTPMQSYQQMATRANALRAAGKMTSKMERDLDTAFERAVAAQEGRRTG